MRRWIFLVCSFLACLSLAGQTNKSIEKMRSQRQEIERQIKNQEKILTSTENSISAQVSNLKIITARLSERTRLLKQTVSEINSLNRESDRLSKEIEKLEEEYIQCTENYAEACRFYQRQNSSLDALSFIMASESFRQMTRRVRYIREYSSSLTNLADEIECRKDTLESKRAEVELLKQEKLELEQLQRDNEQAARIEQQQQQKAVDQLKSKRSQLRKEISAQQKKMNDLAKEIDRQVQLAIREGQKKSSNGSTVMTDEDFKLSGSFENNKGKLPMPISGSYLVVGRYGVSQVAGLKDVKQNNLGIDIQGESGAKALCIFDGTVSQIFQQGKGQIGVLVRHGKYISVYCNLLSTSLKKGDSLKAGDTVGVIQTSENGSPVLHFQLHKESTRLNPSEWLRH